MERRDVKGPLVDKSLAERDIGMIIMHYATSQIKNVGITRDLERSCRE